VVQVKPAAKMAMNHTTEDLVNETARMNAMLSAVNIVQSSQRLREAFKKGELAVVAAMYDLASGVVSELKVFSPSTDMRSQIESSMDAYRITGGIPR